jgi:16S rRNA (guanine966-N2)-methyltransferase
MISNQPRITSGDLRNRKLKLPKFDSLRVVMDRVRQAIFLILGEKIIDAKVADIFAGSGVLGFESISRGAQFVDFVDENYSVINTIQENAKLLGVSEKIAVHHHKAIGFLANSPEKYHIIFLDPFYEDSKHKFLLKVALESLEDDGVIVFLHGGLNMKELIEKIDLKVVEERKYSKTIVSFLKKI